MVKNYSKVSKIIPGKCLSHLTRMDAAGLYHLYLTVPYIQKRLENGTYRYYLEW